MIDGEKIYSSFLEQEISIDLHGRPIQWLGLAAMLILTHLVNIIGYCSSAQLKKTNEKEKNDDVQISWTSCSHGKKRSGSK